METTTTPQELREQAIRDRDALQTDLSGIEARIEEAARENRMEDFSRLRERKEALPYLIQAARERELEADIAALAAEVQEAEERSKELWPQVEAAREEERQATENRKWLEVAANDASSRIFERQMRIRDTQEELSRLRTAAVEEPPAVVEYRAPSGRLPGRSLT
jgi:DUF4097 and DUF4098 domain-containing protein YvlB